MAELADEWPSLPPIRTSCSSSYHYNEPNPMHTYSSINSSLPNKPADHHRPYSAFQSPPSSSSSHVKLLHSSAVTGRKSRSFLSKCFPPAPNSAFPKQCLHASPRREMWRSVHGAGASDFRSVNGQVCRAASNICSIATTNAAHSGPLNPKGNACKSHVAGHMHAFTMIPANVVGKKKPPDYTSDEPTSPEVTCMGRVRRTNKHSQSTWDALLNSSEKLCKRKQVISRKQIEYSASRNLGDHELQVACIPRPLSAPSLPRWRKMITLFKDLPSPYNVQRKLRKQDLAIDLSRLRAACGTAEPGFDDRIDQRETGNDILYICQAGEGKGSQEGSCSVLHEEDEGDLIRHSADVPPVQNPNCLLLMRNVSGRSSKVFHNHDDNGSNHDPHAAVAVKVMQARPPADHKNWNKQQASNSFWKSKKLIFS